MPTKTRFELLEQVRALYAAHGFAGLESRFLQKQPEKLYARLMAAGLMQASVLAELGLVEQHALWRQSSRTYAGKLRPQWTWDVVIATAKEIKEREGDLPTVQWFRANGYSSLTSAVHKSGRTWEEVRDAVGCFKTSSFHESRNGMRWLSRPEASLSNFFYARGIEHKRGERYADSYSEQSGRRFGQFDMHFRSSKGVWVDVEIWGDLPDHISKGRYSATRAFKEAWLADKPNFLGIQFQDCLTDARLTAILERFLGVIEPFVFDKPTDPLIQTAHWTDTDEFIASCRVFAEAMPDGKFPGESWLRKRGKFSDRPGPPYNTMAVRINEWLGGIRALRNILQQDAGSTTKWTPAMAVAAWRAFEKKTGLSPSQCQAGVVRDSLSPEVQAESSRIYRAANRHGVVKEARGDRTIPKKLKWTPEKAVAAWQAFVQAHGKTPIQCLGPAQRKIFPPAVAREAACIYAAVRKHGVMERARKG